MPKIEKYRFPSDPAAESGIGRDSLPPVTKGIFFQGKLTALYRENSAKTMAFGTAKNNFLHFANILDNRQKKWLNNYKVVILRSMRNFY